MQKQNVFLYTAVQKRTTGEMFHNIDNNKTRQGETPAA